MVSYNELRNEGKDILEKAGIVDATLDAMLLIMHVTGMDRNGLIMHGTDGAGEDIRNKYLDLIKKRAAHVPLQHITGHQEFMGLDFAVNEHVLIPRQDTECLVEEAMRFIYDGMKVLDLCTGSGCIIISLAKYKNDLEAVGIDISEEALEVARDNARRNDTDVKFILSDLYEKTDDKYDVIISNPPYIRREVIDTLMEEVRDHEPLIALDGGPDGLDFYRKLIEGADDRLIPGGMIFFEIGYDQGEAVSELLRERGYKDVTVVPDLAGNDRVVRGVRSIL